MFTFVVLNDDSHRVNHSRNRYHNLMLSLQFIIVNDCDVSACNAARWCPFRECYDIVSSLVVITSSYIYVCIPVFVCMYVGMYVLLCETSVHMHGTYLPTYIYTYIHVCIINSMSLMHSLAMLLLIERGTT